MTLPAAPAGTGIEAALATVRARIAAATERAGRDQGAVRLVAVTKTVTVARIAEALACGVTDIGENRVQEAAAKHAELGDAARWHLLGHLQTNKAGRASSIFDIVHSIDGERVAAALATRRPGDLGDLDVLLEVELTGLPNHTGFREAELEAGLAAVAAIPRLRVRGLMTMAPPDPDLEHARSTFARLSSLRDALQQRTGRALPELSMGMSDDYWVAVEEGATLVRLGRALFGARAYGERSHDG
ncbi:MAG TPA: YggS family pyridoxal phosphate-dependent enzyme [Candidatus Dormibacteraeota bacterium]